MHGGSGSTQEEIQTAVKNGVIKMNIDTDTQWAYWDGLKNFYKKNEGYLQVCNFEKCYTLRPKSLYLIPSDVKQLCGRCSSKMTFFLCPWL